MRSLSGHLYLRGIRILFLLVTTHFTCVNIGYATSCIKIPNYYNLNINPSITEPITENDSVIKLLNKTKKTLEGYLDIQFMRYSPKTPTDWPYVGSPCSSFEVGPIFLDEDLKYIPLSINTDKLENNKIAEIEKCIGEKIKIFEQGYRQNYQRFIDTKRAHNLYDEFDFEEHSKRCKVKISGNFIGDAEFYFPKLFFEITEISLIENKFSKIQANNTLLNLKRDFVKEQKLACSKAITSERLNKVTYRFWKTRFDFDAVTYVQKKGYNCDLSLVQSENSEKSYKAEICECASQRKKGTAKNIATWKRQFVSTCQQKVDKYQFICKGYND